MNKGHVYKDKAGFYCWRIVNNNGNTVANGGEAFGSEFDAERAGKAINNYIEWVTDPPEEVAANEDSSC